MSNKKFLAAAIQFLPIQFEKTRNIEMLTGLVEQAAEKGAKLIVVPEMATTGYCWYSREEISNYVEPIPGPTTKIFLKIAEAYNTYIALGLPEIDNVTEIYYNSAVLIGPEGIVGTHRKTHPYISEPKWSAPGDFDHQVFETSIGNIALLICMDIHFIETARLVALRGADVICHLSCWLDERTPAPYWINRAFENVCYVVEGNRWGWERTVYFSGGSCIINPDGSIQDSIDTGDGIAFGEIDVEKTRAKLFGGESLFKDRKPKMYTEIMSNPYLWNPLDFFSLYNHKPLPEGRQSRIGVVQFSPSHDKKYNFDICEKMCAKAAKAGVELLVYPEFSLSGTFHGKESAETIPGPSSDKMIELSIQHKVHLVVGLIESDQDKFYNTAILTGPEGLIGKYRKIHLNKRDKQWASGGDCWATFDLPYGRVGILIGYDSIIPESGRILSLLGCDVILCPSALKRPLPIAHNGTKNPQNYPIPTGADPHHWLLHRVRAGENNVYFAFSNIYDEDEGFFGKSGIFGPDTFKFPREEAIIFHGEGITSLNVDTTNADRVYPTNVVRRKDLVRMRKPILYKDIIAIKNAT